MEGRTHVAWWLERVSTRTRKHFDFPSEAQAKAFATTMKGGGKICTVEPIADCPWHPANNT